MLKLDVEWKAIPEFPAYECSSTGIIKRFGKQLKPNVSKKGYHYVSLYKDSKQSRLRLHRVVYTTFLGEIPVGQEINHLNGIKSDNSLANLECCTHQENIQHSVRFNLRTYTLGKDNKLSVKLLGMHIHTGEVLHFDSQADARRAGFNQGNIQAVLTGKRKHTKGFVWSYA
jgi:hypothetical protein